MAIKSANVTARVEPEIKNQAEAIMENLGLPVSVVINALYRQIILNNGLPFSLNIPTSFPARDAMTKEQFDNMMNKGLAQAKAGIGYDLDEAFDRINARTGSRITE